MFYFCHPIALLKAKGCHSFPTLSMCSWLQIRTQAEKAFIERISRSYERKLGCQNHNKTILQGLWATTLLWTSQWGHPCWLQLGPGCRITCTILSSVLLCPCLSLSFNPVQSCVGASDCPSLGDTCTHWVPQLGETMAFLLSVSDGVGAPPTQDLHIKEDTLTLETQMHHYVLTFNSHPRRWRHWGWLEAKESDVMSFLGLGTLYLSGGFREVKWLAWGI